MNVPGFAQPFLTAVLVGALTSCSGGGGESDTQAPVGIGGSGITVSGTIDGFGSIFVNGVEFETGDASVVLDSVIAGEGDLRLGMVVTVKGIVEDNGVLGVADSVEFDDEVQGPITSITASPDGTEKTLAVFGVSVLVDQTATTFDGVSFETLMVNDVIEVSGFFDATQLLRATRVEKKENFVPNVSVIEVKGLVSGLNTNQFMLGNLTVDFSGADLSDVSGSTLANGMYVEVKGTLSGNTVTATRVEEEDGPFDDDEENVSLEGVINDFVDASNFTVAGQAVDASNAEREPANLLLQNGVQVEVEGPIVNGVLIAEEIEARSGEIKLSAPVQALDVANGTGTITLGFAAGTVSFNVDNQTELGDETNRFDPLTLADISVGDFLEIKALMNAGIIQATEVRLDNDDEQKVRGPVDSFVNGTQITVLGLTYSTEGAEFEGSSSEDFYAQLSVGDLVEIEDDLPADGVADEVELKD
jgi:Domain of unknown function (DUF5666)